MIIRFDGYKSIYRGAEVDEAVGRAQKAITLDGDNVFIGSNTFDGPVRALTPATSDDSTTVATTAFVKAQGYLTEITSENVTAALGYTPVNKAGDTMTGALTLASDDELGIIILKDTNLTKGTAPSSNNSQAIIFKDKDGKNVGMVTLVHVTNGGNYMSLRAFEPQASSSNYVDISVGYNSGGTAYATTGATPSANSNSTNIATTAWVRSLTDQTYDSTSANPQSGVAIAGAGFLTGITSTDVTNALGYTPENPINKVTSISSTSTDTQYPSAKAVYTETNANATAINTINSKIPTQASSSNQLADKAFVNSSIGTQTANFIGTFSDVPSLEAYSGTVTNNDYAFVVNSVITNNGSDWTTFSALDAYNKDLVTNFDYAWVVNGAKFDLYRFDILNQEWDLRVESTAKDAVTLNTAYNRYKATILTNVVTWEYEYTLNNSSFTAAQWAAINSGITSGDVTLIESALQPGDNISELVNDANYVDTTDLATKVDKSGDTMTGDLVLSGKSLYLTGVASTVSGSTSKIYFGTQSSYYNYIAANTSGNFGIYNSAGKGVGCYPTQCIYPTNNIDIGRSNNKWKDIYASGKLYGASSNMSVDSIISGASAGATAIQPNDNITQLTNNAGYITGITSSDVTTALGYTPYDSTNPDGYITGITSSDVTTALGYTPYNDSNPDGFISGITSSDVITALGYTPYDSTNPDGYITGITSSDVTNALGYTPYNSTNPDGFISGITSSDVTTALGYTPYNSTNPNGYITGITSSDITTALGYTPYDGTTNPNGYIVGISSSDVTTALGYTPENVANKVTSLSGSSTDTEYPSAKAVYDAIQAGDITTLAGLTDVSISSPSNNQALMYDSSSSKWKNGNVLTSVAWGDITGTLANQTDLQNALDAKTTMTAVEAKGYITGITSSDVTTALGYTPYDASNPNGYIIGISSSDVTTALGYTPYNSTNPDGFISGITSSDVTTALGYTPYNGATNPNGYITGITSSDVITALGYTPYDSTNPDGFISGITSSDVTTALGYTPYNGTTNPNGYITGITSSDVTTALGYTPYDSTNPDGYITGISSSDVTNALGYTPYNGTTNPNGYITGITSSDVTTALGYTPYNSTNPSGYISSAALSTLTDVTLSSVSDGQALVYNSNNSKWVNSTINSAVWGNISGDIEDQSDLQTALSGKQATITGAASSVVSSDLTASRVVVSDSSGKISASSITTTKLGYLTDVTSNIQSQIDGKTTMSAVEAKGYITGITSSDVTTALGYTPYNSTNPSGYISGITSSDVTTALGFTPENVTNKVTSISSTSTDTQYPSAKAVYTETNANATAINTINGKIPSAASSSNQLADKSFVNSSIATNTANFIGTFSDVPTLEAYSGTVTNNDYAFVVNSVITNSGSDWTTFNALDAYNKDLLTNFDYAWVVNGTKFDLYRFDIVNQQWDLRVQNTAKADVTLNTAYNRYKATVSGSTVTWEYEYTLNNSSFTAAQWAAINSGITSGDVTLIGTALQPNDNITQLTNNAGYITGITSSDVTTALGYTPYNSTNPDGYTTNVGTVTSVNSTSPDSNGNVTLSIPANITDLSDVAVSSPTQGQNLTYDATLGKWKNTSTTATIAWGGITGTLSDQTDLKNVLDNLVTLNTDQNITGVKTFVGQKRIGFKQSTSTDKLGFTLYNNSGTEKGYLEFNPSNTVDSVPLMTLGNYASTSDGLTHVGFRKYSGISGASGAYNLLAPLVSDARTPFNLTTTYTNFYLPLGFTDGSTTVTTAKTGVVDISSFLSGFLTGITSSDVTTALGYTPYDSTNPDGFISGITSSDVTTALGYTPYDSTNPDGYITGITSSDVTTALGYTPVNSSSLATVATSGSYNDLTNTPTIPAAQVQSDWGQTDNTDVDYIKNKPLTPYYGTSSTAADTAIKEVSIPAITELKTGQIICVRPSETSTVATSKIQLNNFTAYNMRYNGANITTSTDSVVWNSAWVSWFVFDGTYWQFAGHGYDNNTNTTYSAMSVSEGTTGTATSSRTVRADYLKQIIQGTTLTGLSTATNSAVVATDSITVGMGKLQAQINASKILINITYDDLVTLKTNSELYEGAFYRITDYVTTCNAYTPRTGEPSRSAGHQFDIIIQALSSSTLSDTGTASLHSGDTYFANCNLGAWKVYYDIENDTNKYKWADTTNGKGVIYRLIDERGNDLPYDFKNIQFYRDGSSSSYTSVASYLTASDGYYYTFSLNTSGTISDYSIDGGSYCQKNIHGALGVGTGIGLPNSVWIETATSKELSNNDIGSNSYNNTCCGVFQRIHCPLGAFTNNITGDTFRNSTLASNFKNNVIGTTFDNNNVGNWFTNNTIGNTFKYNTVGESVRYCTFGTTTQYSRIGNYVVYMTFGNSFNTGVIENYVSYISIPANTYNLTIKNNTSGASGSVLDCSGLPTSVNYSVTLRLDVNSGYIATWNDGITEYGKYKATSSTATWTDVNNKQVQADWNQTDNTAVDFIKNKPNIPSGVIVDQTYDGTSANAQSGVAIAGAGFLTGITSSDVTTALGYTPVNPSSLATVATSGAYSDLTGTPSVMTGATSSAAGTSGLTPAPSAGDEGKFLKGDGTWGTPAGLQYAMVVTDYTS